MPTLDHVAQSARRPRGELRSIAIVEDHDFHCVVERRFDIGRRNACLMNGEPTLIDR
jgi:hypothetical protein